MKGIVVLLVLCSAAIIQAERHHNEHSGRRRNMIDQNRTPRRGGLAEQAEQLAGTVEGGAQDDSCDLRGAWYNQHGSELILNQTEDGRLTGEFRTAVRLGSTDGEDYAERSTAIPIRGFIHGRMFTFHAYFTEKQALTTWSGQCQRNCDFGWLRSERDILHASWLIKSSTSQCQDYWAATRIGEDIFTRSSMKSGPRRADEISAVGVDTA